MYSVGELVGAELVGAELVGLFVGDAALTNIMTNTRWQVT